MKNRNLILGAALAALSFTSCKSDQEKQAEKTVTNYTTYTDSIGSLSVAEAKTNWQAIEASYNSRTTEAEAAVASADKTAQEKVAAGKAKYEGLKAQVQAEMEKQAAAAPDPKQKLRDAFFGAGKIGEDMNFSWVNKDNILTVYNDFYNEFMKNKDNYSREDFDEIKAMYEALDAHKNKVEKEGLSSKDNMKIAELKLKFAPKFKWERMGAKASENESAKESAK